MHKSIRDKEEKMRDSKGLESLLRRIGLFFVYLYYGIDRALHVLFSSSNHSFAKISSQDEYGVWKQSYNDHVEYKRSARLFSVTTPVAVVVASVMLFGVMQLLFPTGVARVYAATNIFPVTNNNDSGAGSLRQAITDANTALVTDENIIRLDFNTADSPLTLLSSLPLINKPVKIENPNADVVFIIDGTNLGGSGKCLEFGPGASNSELKGLALQNCAGSAVTFGGAPTGIKIGAPGGADKDHVYISNSGTGILAGPAVGSTTIQNVTIGINHNGVNGSNTSHGISIQGDGHTISDVVIGNSQHGISLSGLNNTVTSSFIGVQENGTDIGNREDGINSVTSGPNTIGGTTLASANVIGFNDGDGIELRDNSNNSLIRLNYIGTNDTGSADYGNTGRGIVVRDTDGVQIGASDGSYTTLIANNGLAGAYFETADRSKLYSVRSFNNGSDGVYIETSNDVLIDGNEVYSNGQDGFNFNTLTSSSLTNNWIGTREGGGELGNTGTGILVATSNDLRIGAELESGVNGDGNTIANSGANAVNIDNGSNGIILSRNSYIGNGGTDIANSGVVSVPTISAAQEGGDISGDGGNQNGYIQIYRDGLFLGQVSVSDANGDWTTAALGGAISEGDELNAINIDNNEHTSPFSNSFTVAAPADNGDGDGDGDGGGDPDSDPDPDPDPAVTIDSVSVDAGVTAADITVETSRESTVVVDYGRSANDLSKRALRNASALSHTLAMVQLEEATNYVARVTVTDSDNNTATEDVTFKTRGIDTAYFINAFIDGQKVYSYNSVLYVDPASTKITIKDANDNHQVKLTLTDEDDNEYTAETEWKQVDNGTVSQTITDLESGVEYELEGEARIGTDTKTQTPGEDIARVIASAAAPQITSLDGEYTVTTRPQSLQFEGTASTGQFRFQNVETGSIVATCPLDVNGICELPFALSQGVYNVLHESLSNGIPSAPDMHTLVVTYPRATSVLNTDADSTTYNDRIVTSSQVTLAGLGPANGSGTVRVNGVSAGTVTYTDSIVWQKTINLDELGVQRGTDFLVTVVFNDANGDRVHLAAINHPAHYAFVPVQPVLGELAAQYTQSAQFNVSVTGGAGDTVRVFANGELFHTATIPTGSTIGAVEVPVYTAATGSITYKVESENTIGLKASTEATYSVVALSGSTTDSGSTTETTETDTDTTGDTTEQTGSETDTTTDPETDTTGEQITQEPTIGLVSDDEDVTEIPVQYRTVVTNETERQEIKKRLEDKNIETLAIEAVRVSIDERTGEQIVEVVEKNAQGQQILRSSKKRGLPAIEVPFVRSEESEEEISFSGQTEPYALVTLEIHSDPIVQVARADEDGKWTMTVNVDDLPEGSHTAYLQTESRGVESDQIEIAKFVVVEESSLSNTTWIFIINISVVLIVLAAWLVSQVRKRQTGAAVGNGGNMTVVLPSSADEVEDAVAEEKDDDDSDDGNFHSALGV